MCLAILNKKGSAKIPYAHFKQAWKGNKDGGGISYYTNKKTKVEKTMDGCKAFYAMYSDAYSKSDGDILIHFRYATHGTISVENTHPFKVSSNTTFIHNGMLPHNELKHVKHSDTYMLNEILKTLPGGFIREQKSRDVIEKYIGGGNKLVFLHHGVGYILNEKAGHWKNGSWYSNYCYIETPQYNWGYFGKKEWWKHGNEKITEPKHKHPVIEVQERLDNYCEICFAKHDVRHVVKLGYDMCGSCRIEYC